MCERSWSFAHDRGTTRSLPALLPLSLALFAALLSAPVDRPTHEFDAPGLDAAAVELGLRARAGDELEGWAIMVESVGGARYSLRLRGPGDELEEQREIELTGQTDEDRSRELASTLALIIEDHGEIGAPLAPRLPRAFVAVEGHLGLGPPRAPDLDLGVGLGGGVWLLRDHLQPRLRVAWSHGWSGALRVNQLDVGLGLAAGASVGGSRRPNLLWIGGLVMPTFSWNHIEQVRSATIWSGGGELGVLAQLRLPRLVVGVRTGVETTFPAIRALGSPDVIRLGHLRWLLAIELGLGFLG